MDKETLFKEIRQSRTLLWAGAGFSRYAGYPMGSGVVQALYNALPSTQQQKLTTALDLTESAILKLPLPDFAQYFLDLHHGNKQRLTQVINQLFTAAPLSKKTHEQIAAIPHFDKIVTTNYDQLFEMSYRVDKLHVVTQADNVPQSDDKAVTLFKIHGELSRPNSLIVTQNDYRRFFDKADDVVWTQLRSFMSTRTIVFIGYAVEDPNVLDIFLEIVDRLGNLMKPAYVVGPSMDFLRIERLKRQNIYFIQSTGEDFIEELIGNINDNIIKDVELGFTSADTFKTFMASRDLRAKLSSSKDGFRVSDLTRNDGQATAKINLDFNENPELRSKIAEVISGFGYEPITLHTSELKNSDIRIEDLKLPMDGTEEYRVVLVPLPIHEGLYDFWFDDFELNNINVKIYQAQQGYKVVVVIHTAIITLDANPVGESVVTHLSFENTLEDADCRPSSTKEQIEIHQFILNLSNGKSFKCFSHLKQIAQEIYPISNNLSDFSNSLNYFKALRDIEKEFSIRFAYFKDINKTYSDVFTLQKAINNTSEEARLDTEIPLLKLGDKSDLYRNAAITDDSFRLRAIKSVRLLIHGKSIAVNLVSSLKFINPVIIDCERNEGLCIKSDNNLFIVTHKYEPYNESSL